MKEKKDTYDYINPQHYVQDDGKQTWERMIDQYGIYETAVFCKLNAFKYKDRRGKKPNEEVEREDKKIKWYEDKAAELFEILDDMGDAIIYNHINKNSLDEEEEKKRILEGLSKIENNEK